MNPFTEKFLRQLDALRNHKEYSEIEPIVTDLLAMNSLEIIRSMTEDLSENFRKIENTYLSLEKTFVRSVSIHNLTHKYRKELDF
ncbi:hypothetical protein Q2295_08050 [Leptospira interrogans]|uniref:Uncharacterized protein n=1 Tax=Leptospira interrogans serovar Pomona TaxID=44276 RepID=A0AA40W871_LEPIR|nr:hypothetical protein [Leptospira interrogans]MCD1182736.1 hypothetical protein [Leptospira sp. Pond_2020]EJO76718.1 hypothetical protein LEP1GSC045_2542 [Leptospira interrogans serovar Pomona str. Kennewicki LC82-25]EKN99547.1 hypothetical protein LEP1GSC014_3034 [Leptospira interrogans serovar Pomona str. Pomona]EMF32127.1 hypothetical protein LEP1GSC201_2908 [Leptospira interrogans serovar Pomona str. Fox 32256]EMI63522.1 hypothetical protein LEP1GSC200_4217 [Leptospira interrogans serova